jgi:hypothetical protein
MNLIGTILVYAGLAASFFGVVSLLKPLTFLGIVSPRYGLLVVGCGIVFFLIGEALPVNETQIQAQQTELDKYVRVYQFEEFHSILVHSPRERVFKAIQEISADDGAENRIHEAGGGPGSRNRIRDLGRQTSAMAAEWATNSGRFQRAARRRICRSRNQFSNSR